MTSRTTLNIVNDHDDDDHDDDNDDDDDDISNMIERMLHAALHGDDDDNVNEVYEDRSDDDDDYEERDHEANDEEEEEDLDVERMLHELIHLYSQQYENEDNETILDENQVVNDFNLFVQQQTDKEIADFLERNRNDHDMNKKKVKQSIIKVNPEMIKKVKARHAELIHQNRKKGSKTSSATVTITTAIANSTTMRGIKRWNTACPWFTQYSSVSLILIMLLFFIIIIITILVIHNFNYNTIPNTNWMLVGSITENSATFRIRQQSSSDTSLSSSGIIMTEIFVLSKSNDLLNNDSAIIYEENLPVYTTSQEQDDSNSSSSTSSSNSMIHSIYIQDMLSSNTRYYYGTVLLQKDPINGYTGSRMASSRRVSTFLTAPPLGIASSFTFATAGCAWTGSNHIIFDAIRQETESLLFFLHLGDLHYADLITNDLSLRINAIDIVMGSSTQSALYATTALVYMYDDHDWLGNDSNELTGTHASVRTTALQSYLVAIPHYIPLPAYYISINNNTNTNTNLTTDTNEIDNENDEDYDENDNDDENAGGMYHAFTIGTVRFIISDLRSEARKFRIYSDIQKQWLYHELSMAKNYDFVIWVTTRPWSRDSDDSWSAWPYERQELSLFISQIIGGNGNSGNNNNNGSAPQNLLVISADAHMLAFDDGTNTYFGNDRADYENTNPNITTTTPTTTTDGSNSNSILSFPLLQSGPLDRLGSTKDGGRGFTSGCTAAQYERNHHYSVIEFVPPSPPPINYTDGTSQEEVQHQEACLVIKSYRLVDHGTASKSFQKELVESQRLCGKIFSPAAATTTTTAGTAAAEDDDSATNTGSCESTYFSKTNTAIVGSSLVLLVVAIIMAFFLPPPPSLSRSSTTSANAAACHEWKQHFFVILIILLMWLFTIAIGILIPRMMSVPQFDSFAIFLVSLLQMIAVVIYLGAWIFCFKKKRKRKGQGKIRRKGKRHTSSSSVTTKKTGSITKEGYIPSLVAN